jgi:hypothetical protein
MSHDIQIDPDEFVAIASGQRTLSRPVAKSLARLRAAAE